MVDCARIVKHFYAEHGGISGFTAHTKLSQYGGLQVNGKQPIDGEVFELREHFRQNVDDGFKFCKTYRFPYDTIVVACLTVLKHRLGDALTLSSDGNFHDWSDGVKLARQVTGLKLVNPLCDCMMNQDEYHAA
jgi:hypothetical protein